MATPVDTAFHQRQLEQYPMPDMTLNFPVLPGFLLRGIRPEKVRVLPGPSGSAYADDNATL
jgi:hypothetical protein